MPSQPESGGGTLFRCIATAGAAAGRPGAVGAFCPWSARSERIEGLPVSLEDVRVELSEGGKLDSSSALNAIIVLPVGFQPFERGVDEETRLPEGVAWYREDVLANVDKWEGVDVADLPAFMKNEAGQLVVRSYSVPSDKVSQFDVRPDPSVEEARHHSGFVPMEVRGVLTSGRFDATDEKVFAPNLKGVANGFDLKAGADGGEEGRDAIPLNLSVRRLDSSEDIVSLSLEVVDPGILNHVAFIGKNGDPLPSIAMVFRSQCRRRRWRSFLSGPIRISPGKRPL